MAVGRVSGHVMLRPVRMALLLSSEPSSLQRAVRWATSTWGGLYSPVFEAAADEGILNIVGGLGIDVVYPVDDQARANQIVDTTGFRWQGGGGWGPYEEPQEYMSARLLSTRWLVDRLPEEITPFLATWDESDPLAELLAVWLGSFGTGEHEQALVADLRGRGSVVEIENGGPVATPSGISPIELAGMEIQYSGLSEFHGFVVVDAADPEHLRQLWNTRALGGDVFPWPLHGAGRLEGTARSWIADRLAAGRLSTWRRGDGTPLPPHASVMLPNDETPVPADLQQLLADAGVSPFPDRYHVLTGWTGTHPFATDFERTYAVEVEPSDWSFSVPLPELPLALRRNPLTRSMIVAADVEIYRQHGLGSARWAALPNVRGLADLLTGGAIRSTFRRPTHGGRAAAVEVSAEECPVEVLPAMDVVGKLFQGSSWDCSQSDNGRFAGRLADILGGPGTPVANQPAVREALVSTVRSPTGKTVRQLLDTAKKHGGSWPKRLLWNQEPDAYAQQVVNLLLYRKLLRPHLSVRCPECAITTTMRPEDLSTSVSCEMCAAEFPLGFALAQARAHPAWHYRLHQDIGEDRLLEALALLATASAVGAPGLLESGGLHQFGVELKTPRAKGQPPGHECEIDFFMVLHDRGQPEVIVGEVKNRGSLEQQDLDNLLLVQRWFGTQGVDCYPLFATLRDELRTEERDILRTACETAPRVRGSQVLPLFPIVLLRPDLSTAPHEPDHPRSWRISLGAYSNFAAQSCARNLGLVSTAWLPPPSSSGWACQWS